MCLNGLKHRNCCRPLLTVIIAVICLFYNPFTIDAQSYKVQGYVFDSDSTPLPYAGIYIVNKEDGIATNINGFFQTSLPPGTYEWVFSYIGFQQQRKIVEVGQEDVWLNVTMVEQSYLLEGALVGVHKEDPAYTIIRKAISKAKYHRLQCERYEAEVYLKGSTLVNKAPRIFRSRLKEEGIQIGEAYTLESVSKVEFSLPDNYKETVISIKRKGGEEKTSPNAYVNASFYNPLIANNVSPLSPSAMYYYRYKYEGRFYENEQWIYKIEVIPKSPGPNVFRGFIYLLDQQWAIHSIDVKTTLMGVNIHVMQEHAKVGQRMWMPVKHKVNFHTDRLGFKVDFRYNAIVKYLTIVPNKNLPDIPEILDEQIETVPEEYQTLKRRSSLDEQLKTLETKEKITRKDLSKVLKNIEKEQMASGQFREYRFEIDSNAYEQDSGYWERIRPIPLLEDEIRSYALEDSLLALTTAEQKERNRGGNPWVNALFFGKNVPINPTSSVFIHSPLRVQMNSPEGFMIPLLMEYAWENENKKEGFNLTSDMLYGTSTTHLYHETTLRYRLTPHINRYDIYAAGGRTLRQFHTDNPISPYVNTLYSLLGKQHLIRLLSEDKWELGLKASFNGRHLLEWRGGHYRRQPLSNTSSFSLLNRSREFAANIPAYMEGTGIFDPHQVWMSDVSLTHYFGVKLSKINGVLRASKRGKPMIGLRHQMGNYGRGHSFHHLQIKSSYTVKAGVKASISFRVLGGYFPLGNPHPVDVAHFWGNETIITGQRNPFTFHSLPYYSHSTQEGYVAVFSDYTFRKCLLNRISTLKYTGIKEKFYINHLYTRQQSLSSFTEVGYAVDQILGIFQIRVGYNLLQAGYRGWLPQIGLAGFIRL